MSPVPDFLEYSQDPLDLGDDEGRRFRRHHVFEKDDVHAVNAALAAGRPLLLRGKPGTGKSQLALAAAVALGRAFVSQVIDARTESRDLLWRFDAVHRLADAQVNALGRFEERRKWLDENTGNDLVHDDLLHESFYITPGPLWWAFGWESAARQAKKAQGSAPIPRKGCSATKGVVVLIDEIDKADSSVPNGLLGALGDGTFSVPGFGEVGCGAIEPLVVITTNEERSLPDAFLRRCAVHELRLSSDPQVLEAWLMRLGEAHFPGLGKKVLQEAIRMVVEDRQECLREELNPPGGAEYLDLLRVVSERSSTPEEAKDHLAIARRFLLRKHPRGTFS
jgi:MoxR-like ATPase